jgi:hypothetical protein
MFKIFITVGHLNHFDPKHCSKLRSPKLEAFDVSGHDFVDSRFAFVPSSLVLQAVGSGYEALDAKKSMKFHPELPARELIWFSGFLSFVRHKMVGSKSLAVSFNETEFYDYAGIQVNQSSASAWKHLIQLFVSMRVLIRVGDEYRGHNIFEKDIWPSNTAQGDLICMSVTKMGALILVGGCSPVREFDADLSSTDDESLGLNLVMNSSFSGEGSLLEKLIHLLAMSKLDVFRSCFVDNADGLHKLSIPIREFRCLASCEDPKPSLRSISSVFENMMMRLEKSFGVEHLPSYRDFNNKHGLKNELALTYSCKSKLDFSNIGKALKSQVIRFYDSNLSMDEVLRLIEHEPKRDFREAFTRSYEELLNENKCFGLAYGNKFWSLRQQLIEWKYRLWSQKSGRVIELDAEFNNALNDIGISAQSDLKSDFRALSLVIMGEKFQSLISRNKNSLLLVRAAGADNGRSLSNFAGNMVQVTKPAVNSTEEERTPHSATDHQVKEHQKEELKDQKLCDGADEIVQHVSKNAGVVLAKDEQHLRRIVREELKKLKDSKSDQYFNLRNNYLKSLDEQYQRLLNDVRTRVGVATYEKQIDIGIEKLMLTNPERWAANKEN